MEGAIPLISEFIGESLAMRAVSRRWRSELEFDDRLFLRALASKYGKRLDTAVYRAISSGDAKTIMRLMDVQVSLIPKELRDPSFWDRMSYITFSKDILRAIYPLVSQRARMRLDMLLGNPLSQYALRRIDAILNSLKNIDLKDRMSQLDTIDAAQKELGTLLRDSMDIRVLEKFLELGKIRNIDTREVDEGLEDLKSHPVLLARKSELFYRIMKGDISMTYTLLYSFGDSSGIAAWVDNPDIISKTGGTYKILYIVRYARGFRVMDEVAKSSGASSAIDDLRYRLTLKGNIEATKSMLSLSEKAKVYPRLELITPNQIIMFLNRVIKLNPDSKIVNRAIAYAYELGAKEVLHAYATKANVIDIVSRIRGDIEMDESLHPEWFLYYLKDKKLKSPISDPLFWRKLLAAALRNNNYPLVLSIIRKHKRDITPEIKANMMSIASSYMKETIAEIL